MNKFIQRALKARNEELDSSYSNLMETLRALAAQFFGDDWNSYIQEGIGNLLISGTNYYLYIPIYQTGCFLLGKRDDSSYCNATLIYSFASLGTALKQAGEKE